MVTNTLNLIKGVLGRALYIIPHKPERIQIEITNRCNLTCGMCPRESFNLTERDIPSGIFKKIIDRMDSPYIITLTGWGEPLLHPELIEMITYTKQKGHRVGITTNGLLLSPFVETFTQIPLDKLTVSLDSVEDGHGDTDAHPSSIAVRKNIKSLIKHRGTGTEPLITIQVTMHNKEQCLQTVKFAGEVGADRVYLVRLNNPMGKGSFKRPDMEEEQEIYKHAEEIAKDYGLQIDNNYTAFDNRLLRLTYKHIRPALYKFDKYCPKPYDYLYINIDGNATPCCDLPRYEVGSVLKQDISSIWKGENMQYFREHQTEICGTCDALRLKHLTEKVI